LWLNLDESIQAVTVQTEAVKEAMMSRVNIFTSPYRATGRLIDTPSNNPIITAMSATMTRTDKLISIITTFLR
jgi:hypothetical protein